MQRGSWPYAPASSALPKPMEGALASGAATVRPAGAAGEKAAGDDRRNISIRAAMEDGDRSKLGRGSTNPPLLPGTGLQNLTEATHISKIFPALRAGHFP